MLAHSWHELFFHARCHHSRRAALALLIGVILYLVQAPLQLSVSLGGGQLLQLSLFWADVSAEFYFHWADVIEACDFRPEGRLRGRLYAPDWRGLYGLAVYGRLLGRIRDRRILLTFHRGFLLLTHFHLAAFTIPLELQPLGNLANPAGRSLLPKLSEPFGETLGLHRKILP